MKSSSMKEDYHTFHIYTQKHAYINKDVHKTYQSDYKHKLKK